MNVLVPLVVTIPLLGAALALALGRRSRYQVLVSVLSLTSVVVISAILLVLVDQNGPAVVHVGDWQAPWGIVLVVDRLSAIMLIVSALMLLGVLLFAVFLFVLALVLLGLYTPAPLSALMIRVSQSIGGP